MVDIDPLWPVFMASAAGGMEIEQVAAENPDAILKQHIDPGMGLRNLGVCLREAAPQAFIGVPKAHLARVALGWARDTIQRCITVGRRLGWSGSTLDQPGTGSGTRR